MTLPSTLLNLEWSQHPHYWLAMRCESAIPAVTSILSAQGWQKANATTWLYPSPYPWMSALEAVAQPLQPFSSHIQAAVIGGESKPDNAMLDSGFKPLETLQEISQSIWLADALTRGDVLCYFQPVVGANKQPVGYESFARVRMQDGRIVAGEAIIKAARALGIAFSIDRHLHVQAIKTFISGKVSGFLFINFLPGFIQRPEIYLEGLSEAAKEFHVIPKNIVLDFTQSELPRDINHLHKVTDYCRNQGYALALDDMESPETVKRLVPEIRPDFIKLDRSLVQRYARAEDKDHIRRMVAGARSVGALTIAEGVETEETFNSLKELGVELFQGYYFAAPQPVEMF